MVMRIARVEHMSVLHDGRPAGPYAESPFRNHEHCEDPTGVSDMGVEEYWGCDSDWDEGGSATSQCIHDYCDQLSWITDGNRPTPHKDGIDMYAIDDDSRDYIFGFVKAEQLTEWFTGEFKRLHGYGFVVGVYSVPAHYTKHGWSQSIFKYSESVRVAEVPILRRTGLADLLCYDAR
jgi:hypothetical protein